MQSIQADESSAVRYDYTGVSQADESNKQPDAGLIFFFNDPATTEIYTTYDTLSLHDALPIWSVCPCGEPPRLEALSPAPGAGRRGGDRRSCVSIASSSSDGQADAPLSRVEDGWPAASGHFEQRHGRWDAGGGKFRLRKSGALCSPWHRIGLCKGRGSVKG